MCALSWTIGRRNDSLKEGKKANLHQQPATKKGEKKTAQANACQEFLEDKHMYVQTERVTFMDQRILYVCSAWHETAGEVSDEGEKKPDLFAWGPREFRQLPATFSFYRHGAECWIPFIRGRNGSRASQL